MRHDRPIGIFYQTQPNIPISLRALSRRWYWAQRQAHADVHETCPSRRLARWAAAAGQRSYWYYWTYTADGQNGQRGGGVHDACCDARPFVFHVLKTFSKNAAEVHLTGPAHTARLGLAFWL